MDSEYLNKNVSSALSEAISSMVVASQEDKIEHIAKSLLQYVERRRLEDKRAADLKVAEEGAKIEYQNFQTVEMKKLDERQEAIMKASQYPQFLDSLIATSSTKQDAMNNVTKFIATFFNIPAAYVAIKRQAGETETLNYYSANPGQEHVVGKKITKPAEEGDEAPARQGLSFDAFKLPEVPEGEAEEMDEEGNPIPKPPPKPVPLVIDNVMRDRRCKFFGIPKLGSYIAIPLTMKTVDHEAGCAPNPGDGENPGVGFAMNKINQDLIIGCDTIGNFRRFTSDEISKINDIGYTMVSVMEKIEEKMFEQHTQFLDSYKAVSNSFAETVAKIAESEAAALAAVATELTVDPAQDPPPEPQPETLKPYRDAEAVINVWNQAMASAEVASCISALSGHVLPTNQATANLFYAIANICGISSEKLRDVCGDISWENVRSNLLSEISTSMSQFNATNVRNVNKETSFAGLKAFVEGNNVFDAAAYPASIPVLVPLSQWLQKALIARETALAYFKEVKNVALETSN